MRKALSFLFSNLELLTVARDARDDALFVRVRGDVAVDDLILFHMCIGKMCCTVTFFSRYSMPRPSLPSPRRGSSGAIAAVISGAMALSVASLRTAEASFSMAAW